MWQAGFLACSLAEGYRGDTAGAGTPPPAPCFAQLCTSSFGRLPKLQVPTVQVHCCPKGFLLLFLMCSLLGPAARTRPAPLSK